MLCPICKQEIVEHFNNYFINKYCLFCHFEIVPINMFKIIIGEKIFKLRGISNSNKDLMINYLNSTLFSGYFGKLKSIQVCKACPDKLENKCYIYSYKFLKLKYKYCVYNDLIFYYEKDMDNFIKSVYNHLFFKRLKIKLQNYFNNVRKFFIIEKE